uniref:VWFA domain-containing protein n=1 Tax=Panagrolaimus sp. PS1159 TaxID=55785 RepID=A0AC35GJ35_9BILA
MNFIWKVLFGAVLVTALTAAEKHLKDHQYYHNKCEQSSGAKVNCKLDLTVAVDMSWSMKSRKNVLKLANFTIDKVIDQYAINYQYSRIAVQTLGSWAFSQSPYFDRFGHVCEFISHAADTFPFFGNDFFQLSKVFKSYLLSNILPTPKKRVLVIFTAIK